MKSKLPATLFGQRLREARRRADLPQDKLGVKIGLDEGTASARISRYETGIHEPAFGVAVKLAHALQLPAAFFYCEDEELAQVVLGWKQLTLAERNIIKTMLEAKFGGAD